MENQVQLFKHEKFGQVRLVIIDGRIHFVAADLCRALEIQNIRQNLAKLPSDEKGVYDIYTPGGYQKMTIVNEPGFYRLVFSSRKKEACDFQRWVYHEVLPSIRKTGSYSIAAPEIPDPAVKKSVEKFLPAVHQRLRLRSSHERRHRKNRLYQAALQTYLRNQKSVQIVR